MTASPELRPRTRKASDDRRLELIEFGVGHFATRSVDHLSMAALAKAAGVSKALLYHYFGGRRGFYEAVVQSVVDELLVTVAPRADIPFPEALERSIEAYLTWVTQKGSHYLLIARGGMGVDDNVAAIVDRGRYQIVDYVLALLATPTQAKPKASSTPSLVKQRRAIVYGWVTFAENTMVAAMATDVIADPDWNAKIQQVLTAALLASLSALTPGVNDAADG